MYQTHFLKEEKEENQTRGISIFRWEESNFDCSFSTNCRVLNLESIDAVQGSFWLRNFRILPKEDTLGPLF